MSEDDLTFPGGLPDMLDNYENRRSAFQFGTEPLPDIDVNLASLASRPVPENATVLPTGSPTSSWDRKRVQIAKEFVGRSQLAFLNAQLISNLRKRSYPRQAPALFCRLWAEQSDHLLATLDLRWLVSSVQTFADHGETPTQREVGHALRMFFGMMKLYEFERLFSGKAPDVPYRFQDKNHVSLPFEMKGFSFDKGGLDTNLIAPIWTKALNDTTIAPLVDHLMTELNKDPGGVFRRLKLMRDRRAARQSRT
ncbi:hypothetical protein HW561_06710 [Rhodobacteraceae bacterium B1Z28]|uniref:Uncharacterized protein n=1 Tax=Ruegeria haliotis TaxID=2747601 RepID=A0ABX2PPY4_9RHOB|nr:hypothetical protein [Ruegeria haliotis]NVO55476.1 hypothetical protein [Ruegeria haliotis]